MLSFLFWHLVVWKTDWVETKSEYCLLYVKAL